MFQAGTQRSGLFFLGHFFSISGSERKTGDRIDRPMRDIPLAGNELWLCRGLNAPAFFREKRARGLAIAGVSGLYCR
jgi:hypothetical protein